MLLAVPAEATWLEDSNRVAQEYALADGLLFPERASALGLRDFDAKAIVIERNANEKELAFLQGWITRLDKEHALAKDTNLRLDLKILRDFLGRRREEIRLEEKHGVIPFYPATRFVMESLGALVQMQAAEPARKAAAVDRFRAYARGDEKRPPLLSAFRNRILSDELRFRKRLAPLRTEIEQYLAESPEYLKGIRALLEASGRSDWKADLDSFSTQAAAYDGFVRDHLLAGARRDFRLPKELYAHTLRMRGIEDAPEKLIREARRAYKELYKEFRALAEAVAKQEGLMAQEPAPEPAAVIAHLKRKQVVKPEEVKALFEGANQTLEVILLREKLVSLPAAPLRIRVAGEAESLANPVPHLREPPLVGNTGQRPEFVVPSFGGAAPLDDFSYEAAALVVTAHEGRPGHDLQFASMLDQGTSLVRARYAFNNANVEGWGLYAEEMVFPHLPPAAQLVALQMRLVRVARAFLDPELQLGRTSASAALALLRKELGLSEGLAQLEVQRFQFGNPGQAPAYFYGYQRVAGARRSMAGKLGKRFRDQCFHDGVLSLGIMPVGLLGGELAKGLRCGPAQARIPSGSTKN